MKVKCEEIEASKNLKLPEIIGGSWTFLAIKNPSSFMIGTKSKGLVLIDDNKSVYASKLHRRHSWFRDMIYVKSLNCYFIDCGLSLYRKDIDEKPAYLYMKYVGGYREGACFRYSKINQRLIVNKGYESLAAINLATKQIEIEVKKSDGDCIRDFRIFGKRENQAVSLTKDALLEVFQFNYQTKTGKVISNFKIVLKAGRNESGVSIAVGGNNEYFLVELESGSICSRMLIFKLDQNNLVLKASIDQFGLGVAEKFALEYYGRVGRSIIWVGLSMKIGGLFQAYEYDTYTEEIQEVTEKREIHWEKNPCRLNRLGKNFYFTGELAKIKKLSIEI